MVFFLGFLGLPILSLTFGVQVKTCRAIVILAILFKCPNRKVAPFVRKHSLVHLHSTMSSQTLTVEHNQLVTASGFMLQLCPSYIKTKSIQLL